MMSLSKLETRSLFRALAMSDSVTVFRIASGIGKGSVAVVAAWTGSSVGFFFPNRISCVRSWNGAFELFPRNRSIPLATICEGRVPDYYRFSRGRLFVTRASARIVQLDY